MAVKKSKKVGKTKERGGKHKKSFFPELSEHYFKKQRKVKIHYAW